MSTASTAAVEQRPLSARAGESLDSICGVRILQRRHGYRFNLDPVLLVHFAMSHGVSGPAIDLGTGAGVIPLLLAHKFDVSSLTGLELQPELYALAQRNVQLNQLEDRVALVNGDLRRAKSLFPAGAFSAVFANPPYRPAALGNVSPNPERAIARHELSCTLQDVVAAAAHLLRNDGAFHMVYPAARLHVLLQQLLEKGLAPATLKLVHPRGQGPAKLALLTSYKGRGRPLEVLPPLFVHADDRPYTEEVARMLMP
ncbi:MAG: tRNA1(Val) (adenine(37)-N6)-methyltransferase [Myxococcaceae bacterium]